MNIQLVVEAYLAHTSKTGAQLTAEAFSNIVQSRVDRVVSEHARDAWEDYSSGRSTSETFNELLRVTYSDGFQVDAQETVLQGMADFEE